MRTQGKMHLVHCPLDCLLGVGRTICCQTTSARASKDASFLLVGGHQPLVLSIAYIRLQLKATGHHDLMGFRNLHDLGTASLNGLVMSGSCF